MNASLYLFPSEPFANPPETSVIQQALEHTGLAGNSLEDKRFLVGDKFFQHISFAGCSPWLQLEPPAGGGDKFTHISIAGPLPSPRLISASQHARPRCPHCGKRMSDWKTRVAVWQTNPTELQLCPSCKQSSTAATLDWRHYAACGRVLVEIHQVYPGEAVPGDGLMAELGRSCGCEWRFAWADSL